MTAPQTLDLTAVKLTQFAAPMDHHAHFENQTRYFAGFAAFGESGQERLAIARRLVACWNTFAGVADPEGELARLRAIESAVGHVQSLGEGVQALLPDYDEVARFATDEELERARWYVVDEAAAPAIVMVTPGVWSMYPDREAMEFDVDTALDLAMLHGGDVLRVVRVG